MTPRQDQWGALVALIEQVASTADLMDQVARDVRGSIKEISGLDAAEVSRSTRGLFAASTAAIAERRGPTEAELSFVAALGTTRARQGIPIEAVLHAIHVAERRIWARAREVARGCGVDPFLLLEARELYDDWTQAVRGRLLAAHAAARGSRAGELPSARDAQALLLARLLQGGSAAALAAAEAGLPQAGLVVLVAVTVTEAEERTLTARRLAGPAPAVVARNGSELVAVLSGPPRARALAGVDRVVGQSGPGAATEVPVLRELAAAAAAAGAERGRTGLVPVASVASLIAVADRADLARVLTEHHRAALAGLGRHAAATIGTVRAWIECGCDANAAAAREFVHPNTVRNRVEALTRATGSRATDALALTDLWWLCRTWQADHP